MQQGDGLNGAERTSQSNVALPAAVAEKRFRMVHGERSNAIVVLANALLPTLASSSCQRM